MFLRDYQYQAVDNLRKGCILNGGVGSGKSRTALYHYFTKCGGQMEPKYVPMKDPKDLYIITTAMKRDTLEFEFELALFALSTDSSKNKKHKNVKIVIDSWQNITKYTDVKNAFFIFDEDRLTGNGVWVKSFLKISKSNYWIILSATPGDDWKDYIPVFIANGFYRNRSAFLNEHAVYARWCKFPKIERYVNVKKLEMYRDSILVDMDFHRDTIQHHEYIQCEYDKNMYKDAIKTRWDPYKNEPMQQASVLCYILRRIVNEHDSRQEKLLEIFEKHNKLIIFYNFNYELELLKNINYGPDVTIAEWNGHAHEKIPSSDKWIYLVQYTAGCEGWNCIKTDTIVFYSQNYSYKVMAQASGRIDRLNTPYKDLYYYHLVSKSSIDNSITLALRNKKEFNERKFTSKWFK